MADSLQIAKLSPLHEEIMRTLLAEPTTPRGELAERFGYSESHFSIITNSDIFKARLAEMQARLRALAIDSVAGRLERVACLALGKLEEQLEETLTEGVGALRDRDFVRESADMVLARLGYGIKNGGNTPGGPLGNTINNTVIIGDAQLVQEARERVAQRFLPPPLADSAASD